MALIATRGPEECILELKNPEEGLFKTNHIFEPEFHQDKYVSACTSVKALQGAFRIGDDKLLAREIGRGVQPEYADDDNDPESLKFEGMIDDRGEVVADSGGSSNVCALTSACIRFGFIDTGLARSVTRKFYERVKHRASVKKNDVLVNSTGDGTIGRVAVYDFDFPAVVDGHVAIVRFRDSALAWYVAAYLLSKNGQLQLYRYINGSSGQVEIYPQDIERVWIKPAVPDVVKEVGAKLKKAAARHRQFAESMQKALATISHDELAV
ncbi:hypothetical protein DYQ86_10430 [Acidobacteria bacterium AB60]|nr:hypothetical protein DYQ86_10430 [Acidobacteria bacterium AB60]